MRYVAAYLLCVLGGKSNPSKADITKVLESVGLDIEADRLDKVRESYHCAVSWITLSFTYR